MGLSRRGFLIGAGAVVAAGGVSVGLIDVAPQLLRAIAPVLGP